ncbi:hypothetical protein TNCV_4540241 [Trichonephila clavipes]|nr:hypothetical protein TNCV_4540241 [Trichonephila clavipes]
MSQRRRFLPNSLRWRAVGWMEMGLLQADAFKHVQCDSFVVLLATLGSIPIEDSVIPEDLFQADHELQHLQLKTVF